MSDDEEDHSHKSLMRKALLILGIVLCYGSPLYAAISTSLTSYQQTESHEVISLGTEGVLIRNQETGEEVKIANEQSVTAAYLHETDLLIATDTHLEILDLSTEPRSVKAHFDIAGIQDVSIFKEEDETYILLLTNRNPEFQVIQLSENFRYHLVNAIDLPAEGIIDISLSKKVELVTKEHRYYLLATHADHTLSLWSLEDPVRSQYINAITTLTDEAHRHLHADLSDPKDFSDPMSALFYTVRPSGTLHTTSLRTLLNSAFQARRERIETTENAHAAAMKDYRSSLRYKFIRSYAFVDSFVRGFVPFDDDLASYIPNTYLFGTTPEHMLRGDLESSELVNGFTYEDRNRLVKDFYVTRESAELLGLAALIRIPTGQAQRSFRSFQQARPDKLQRIAHLRTAAQCRLGKATTVKWLDRLETVYRTPAYLNLGTRARAFAKYGFDARKLRMFPKVILVTNITLGGMEMANQVYQHGWEVVEWNKGQMAYNAIIMNSLTGIMMIICGVKGLNHTWKTVAMIGTIDVISPLCQQFENNYVHHEPDRTYDVGQATYDKLFIGLFAFNKSFANYHYQAKAVSWARTRGAPRWLHQWGIPLTMNTGNEIAGNGGYAWTVEWGNQASLDYVLPAVELNEFEFEAFLRNEIDESPTLEPRPYLGD